MCFRLKISLACTLHSSIVSSAGALLSPDTKELLSELWKSLWLLLSNIPHESPELLQSETRYPPVTLVSQSLISVGEKNAAEENMRPAEELSAPLFKCAYFAVCSPYYSTGNTGSTPLYWKQACYRILLCYRLFVMGFFF